MPKVTREDEKKDVLQRLHKSVKELQRRFDELLAPRRDVRLGLRSLWDGDACCLEALGEVEETETEYIVTIDMPMVNKEDIEILVMDDHLAVQAKMREEVHYERWGTIQRQIRFQRLAKKVPLPRNADSDKIRATFRKGLLEIRVPKIKEIKHISIE